MGSGVVWCMSAYLAGVSGTAPDSFKFETEVSGVLIFSTISISVVDVATITAGSVGSWVCVSTASALSVGWPISRLDSAVAAELTVTPSPWSFPGAVSTRGRFLRRGARFFWAPSPVSLAPWSPPAPGAPPPTSSSAALGLFGSLA